MDAGHDTNRTEEPNSLGGCAPRAVIGGARSRRTQRVSRVLLPFGLTSLTHRCACCGVKQRYQVLVLMKTSVRPRRQSPRADDSTASVTSCGALSFVNLLPMSPDTSVTDVRRPYPEGCCSVPPLASNVGRDGTSRRNLAN
jgi:hypothetical protein